MMRGWRFAVQNRISRWSPLPWPVAIAVVLTMIRIVTAGAAYGAGSIERDRVEPNWFAHNTRFWYRVDLFDGRREFVLVDAEKGIRQPAFDHARVATALAKLMGQEVAPDHLPIEALDFESVPGAILLEGTRQVWQLDPATYVVTPHAGTGFQPPSLASIGDPRPSEDGGAETQLHFENHTNDVVKIFWIDTQGQREQYQVLQPGDPCDQQTYAGHVWPVTDQAGNSLGVYVATRQRGSVMIGGGRRPPKMPAPHRSIRCHISRHVPPNNSTPTKWIRRTRTGRSSCATAISFCAPLRMGKRRNSATTASCRMATRPSRSGGRRIPKTCWRCGWKRDKRTGFIPSSRHRPTRCSQSCAG